MTADCGTIGGRYACTVSGIEEGFGDAAHVLAMNDYGKIPVKHDYKHFTEQDIKILFYSDPSNFNQTEAKIRGCVFYVGLRNTAINARDFSPEHIEQTITDTLNRVAKKENITDPAQLSIFINDPKVRNGLRDRLSKDGADARAVFEELKPVGYTAQSYIDMILKVDKEINPQGKTVFPIPPTSISANVAAPAFDQQNALAMLDAHGVKMDETHELKSPDAKAVALNVVKDLKTNIRAA